MDIRIKQIIEKEIEYVKNIKINDHNFWGKLKKSNERIDKLIDLQ